MRTKSAMSAPGVAWWRIPTMSSASVLTFLPAGDCLTTDSFTSKSKFSYDWRSVRQSVLVSSTHLELSPRFLLLSVACLLMRGPSSTREWVCRLQLLLVLARAVILVSQSRRIHDHILQSHIRDSPNPEEQVPAFIYPRNRVAQLYPQVLGSLFVASCNSQGCGGCILTHLQAGWLTDLSNCLAYNISARTAQKTPFFCCCFQLLPCKHACLRSRYSVTAVVFLLISQSFPSKLSTYLNIVISLFLTSQAFLSPLSSYRPIWNKNKLIP
jgi:hypothetical protein